MAKKTQLCQLPVEQLQRGRYQPRHYFQPDELQELADSIKSLGGLLQPIVVRSLSEESYEIIAGERRWRAAQLAGYDRVSCLITEYSDEQALQAAIVENINRSNLNPIEEAKAYQRLYDEFGYTHDEIAATVGKSRVKVTNAMRLLKLDDNLQNLLIEGAISEGHGKILAGIAREQQYPLALKIIEKGWSVRALENFIKKSLNADKNKKNQHDPNIAVLEKELGDHVGCPISIAYDENGKGQLTVGFHNIEILQGVLKKWNFKGEGKS